MASLRELSMVPADIVGHAAFAVWMRESLSQAFNTVLHEPLPQALLAMLDSRTEADADSIAGQGESYRARC